MNDEKRSMAIFQAQPEGPDLCLCPAALSLTHVGSLHRARSALLGKDRGPAGQSYQLRTPLRRKRDETIDTDIRHYYTTAIAK